jgi:excisionase family DNA binding protein
MKLYASADRFVNKKASALTEIFSSGYKAAMKLISTAEAAEKLGVHITRVQVLIRQGRLPAQKVGRNYVIDEGDLKLVENRKPGRPKKQEGKRKEARKR